MEKPRYVGASLHLMEHLEKRSNYRHIRLNVGRLLQRDPPPPTHEVDAVLSQPVEALEKEQEGEEGDEARGEVVSEHSECQARLSHSIPGALDQMLGGGGGKNRSTSESSVNEADEARGRGRTSISAALSRPKKTFLMNFPRRNTSTKAWMYNT